MKLSLRLSAIWPRKNLSRDRSAAPTNAGDA